MVEQQLLCSLPNLNLRVVSLTSPGENRAALQNRGAAVEDEDGADLEEQQFADAAQKSNEVSVADHVALLVAHRLYELDDPDRSIWKKHPRVTPRAKVSKIVVARIGIDQEKIANSDISDKV